MGSLIYDNGAQSQYPPLWAGGTYATAGSVMAVPSWAGVVHATYTISPTLLNEAAFNLNGNDLNIHRLRSLAEAVRATPCRTSSRQTTANKLPAISIGSPYNISYTPGWWPWITLGGATRGRTTSPGLTASTT